ncbi:MAG: VCBS repeat-containing protein, partial [Acidobacteriota bacterium]
MIRTTAALLLFVVSALGVAILFAAPGFAAEPLFEDITGAAGITFAHHSAPEKKYILESMSGGVAVFDYDGDGDLDIYFVNSLTVDTANRPESAASALYRNLGVRDGLPRFEDVAKKAGVAHPGWGMGLCVADVDGDGHRDLYITAVGPDRFYRNRGDGIFEEVAEKLGLVADGWSAGCGFADYDRDGDLDLFVSRYVEIDLENLPEFGQGKSCQFRGIAVQCGPRGLPGTTDLLFRNDGGRFTEVSKAAKVDDPDGYFGLGVAWFDADGDGWLDLYVANDSTPNFLYLNKKDGTFEEAAFPMGVAVSEDGAEQGGMGVAVGDYDGDGLVDLYVTNFAEEYNALYRNADGYFTDESFRTASAASSLPYVGWGTGFFDIDHDGLQDLIAVNGHVYPQLDNARLGASAPYRQRKLLYRNLGEDARGRPSFEEIAEAFDETLTELRVSRGLALGDLDDDGRVDVVINDLDGSPQILRNVRPKTGHWIVLDLRGKAPNPDAIGAQVTLVAAGRTQTKVVRSGTSYL